MITDRNGRVVKEGDTIKFSTSKKEYGVVLKDGLLGSYEDGVFISLSEVLKNFEIIETKEKDGNQIK